MHHLSKRPQCRFNFSKATHFGIYVYTHIRCVTPHNLFKWTQAILPANVMVAGGRLEALLEQAIDWQLARSLAHIDHARSVSLLADCTAGPDEIPSRTVQVACPNKMCKIAAPALLSNVSDRMTPTDWFCPRGTTSSAVGLPSPLAA